MFEGSSVNHVHLSVQVVFNRAAAIESETEQSIASLVLILKSQYGQPYNLYPTTKVSATLLIANFFQVTLNTRLISA